MRVSGVGMNSNDLGALLTFDTSILRNQSWNILVDTGSSLASDLERIFKTRLRLIKKIQKYRFLNQYTGNHLS